MMIPNAETPDAAPAAFPGILGAGLLMLIGWTGAVLTAIATASYLGPEAVTAAASIVGISLAVWVGCRHARAPLTVVLSLRPFPMRWAWPLALMAFSGSFLGAELANWVHRIIPLPEAYQKLFMQLLQADTWQGFVGRAALLSGVAPVMEELMFRGVIQHGLVANYGPRKGIIVTAVCFGVFHLIPWQAVGVTLVGLLLGFVRHRSGSIFASMWVHAVWNLIPLVAFTAARAGGVEMLQEMDLTSPQHLPAGVLIPSAVVFTLSMTAFWRATERRESIRGREGQE